MRSNQVEIDEALAASLLYDCPELTNYDSDTARQFQQQEEEARRISLISDEEMAKELQNMEDYPLISVSDDENYAKLLQEEEYAANHVALADDVSQISHQFQDLEVNRESFPNQQSRAGNSSGSSSQNIHSRPPNVDIDPDNMSYEELNELGESIGAVNKGLSKRRISKLPTHKFGTRSRVSEKIQCSICLNEFKKGDLVSTLPCDHIYHKECISLWLEQNKICCVCTAEV